MTFSTDIRGILERIDQIEPERYAYSRNFIDGSVSYLSPYISRGVISTRRVWEHLRDKGYNLENIEKFVQELAWRDYWQQNWLALGDKINSDVRHEQSPIDNYQLSEALINARTGIQAIDDSIKRLYSEGYIHNHVRMYIAAMACNVARSHWAVPARWFYYHLLDGDWASNTLSWQWVAGSNSNKKYVANQENINKYCYISQQGTFLDIPYEDFQDLPIPQELRDTEDPKLNLEFPFVERLRIDPTIPTVLYNYYNLDPFWLKDTEANRILLIEPEVFRKYPVAPRNIQFLMELSKNIPGVQVFVGEFSELITEYSLSDFHYREHPFNKYSGTEHSREWLAPVTGYHSSFFGYWKKVKKHIQKNG